MTSTEVPTRRRSLIQEQVALRAEQATTLQAYGDGRLVLSPSSEPVPFKSRIVTESDPDGIEVSAAIVVPEMVLAEVHFYEQVQGAIDESELADWSKIDAQQIMKCVAWTIAAPGATLGELEEGEFYPLEALDELEVLKNQSPMIYGQHMRCDSETWDACITFLIDAKYELVTFDRQGPAGPNNNRRKSFTRLGAPTKGHGNYAAKLPQRIKSGLRVDRVTLLSNTDPEREGFSDPLTSFMKNLELVGRDAASSDPEKVRRANSLSSSLTGITTFDGRNDEKGIRAPQQAGIGEITIAGEPFNFFTAAPTPASAVTGQADPFAKVK